MNNSIDAEERAYWEREADSRTLDLDKARSRGDAPHLLTAAQLRLREAQDRLAAM